MTLRDDISERAEARVGVVLKGKWRLDSVIGIGGMATVYAATHRNRSRVAIKMLHSEVAVSQDATTRFLREGYVGNAVAHPGTVKVLDDDVTEDGAPFLVMELLEGESLGARLDRCGPLPPLDVALLADQLLDVLAAAHAARIVHRDLKPDNVFLTGDGRVKVLDFGIARLRDLANESSSSTQAGSLLGTPAFMAPEQALGRWKEVDERTDIWAVGATLFTLLTGRFVHEAETVQEQLVRAATSKAAPVRQYTATAPDWLCAVIDRALEFGRDARYADARSMQGALRASAQGLEFPAYPLSEAGLSGPRSGQAHTPPAMSRPLSSPSFGAGATLVASEPGVLPPRAGQPGTFASVQAVARSAQEPAPKKTKGRSLAALSALVGLGVAAAVSFVLFSRPAAPELGLGAAGLAPVATPPASPSAAPPPVAAPPPATVPAPPVPREIPASQQLGVRPATVKTAAPPAASLPALPSAHAAAADKVIKALVGGAKKPPAGSKAPPPATTPPEHRENLFDIRH